jgi:hypothetical protein
VGVRRRGGKGKSLRVSVSINIHTAQDTGRVLIEEISDVHHHVL